MGYEYKPWKLGVFFEARNLTNPTYASRSWWTTPTSASSSRATAAPSTARSNGDGDDPFPCRAARTTPHAVCASARAARRGDGRAGPAPGGWRSRIRPGPRGARLRAGRRRGRRRPMVAWVAKRVTRTRSSSPGPAPRAEPVRVNPPQASVDSLHQAPGLALGPGGEVYVTWSSSKPKPVGGLFASDLFLSRSLDGGRSFEAPAARERRPADLALVRGSGGRHRRHRARRVDRQPRGREPDRDLARPRDRAGIDVWSA